MSSLTQTTALWTVLVAVACGGCAVVGRPRPRLVGAGLVASGVATFVVVAADAVGLVAGDRPPGGLVTHLGYLVIAPAVLPVTAALAARDRGRWGSACLAVACAVLVVVLVRLQVTRGG